MTTSEQHFDFYNNINIFNNNNNIIVTTSNTTHHNDSLMYMLIYMYVQHSFQTVYELLCRPIRNKYFYECITSIKLFIYTFTTYVFIHLFIYLFFIINL